VTARRPVPLRPVASAPRALPMRILDHPVLGPAEPPNRVRITVDDRSIAAFEGEPVAVAMLAAGIRVCRLTEKRREPRGIFCARGQCTDCVMTVDGRPNVRTCVTPVKDGMRIQTGGG
jgi:predicted molibdopterin-dependent oxidoreductase YjgC